MKIVFALTAFLLLAGCSSHYGKPTDEEKLTVGTVQKEIRIGMAGGDVAQVLGSPNIVSSDEDRNENIRRAAEVAKLLRHNGAIVLVSLITPQNIFRQQVRDILGDEHFLEVYVKASFEACQQRDVKGLYAKAKEGKVAHFSGKTSSFEEPDQADLVIETENQSIEQSLEILLQSISSNIKLDQISK